MGLRQRMEWHCAERKTNVRKLVKQRPDRSPTCPSQNKRRNATVLKNKQCRCEDTAGILAIRAYQCQCGHWGSGFMSCTCSLRLRMPEHISQVGSVKNLKKSERLWRIENPSLLLSDTVSNFAVPELGASTRNRHP